VAKEKREQDQDGGEFAEFLADVSQEIALRVESLQPAPTVPTPERKKTPIAADGGAINEWPNIADRMIEEMR
jgi:hypothetical protein